MMAVIAAGDAGKPVLTFCASLTQVMFKFAGLIMKFAPYGVGAAIAVTVGHQGLGVLLNLGKLVLTLYLALVIFVVFVFGAVIWITKVPLKPFVRAVREPFALAFATANSEAALPDAFFLRVAAFHEQLAHAMDTVRARPVPGRLTCTAAPSCCSVQASAAGVPSRP